VELALNFLVREANQLAVTHAVTIDVSNACFQMIRNKWGKRLWQLFSEIEAWQWLPTTLCPTKLQPIPPKQMGVDGAPAVLQQLALGAETKQQQS
jgi:hypothetical protein